MQTKHTPGPWKHRHVPLRGISDDTYCIDWSEDQEEVAEIVHGEANARLIAVAPELLEVLVKLCAIQEVGDVASWASEWTEARAAISKATGEKK